MKNDKVFKLVENRPRDISEILSLLDISKKTVFSHVYESASLVIALTDKKTLIEVCFAPQLIDQWEETEHSLFQNYNKRKY